MKTLRPLMVALFIPVLALAIFAASAVVAKGPSEKVTICHNANNWHQINISENALPAHLAHGDVFADEYGDCPS